MLRRIHSFLVLAPFVAAASGQSINIDWGEQFGSPGSDYPGAGRAGLWNSLHGDPVRQALVGLDGSALAASATFEPGTITFGQNHVGTSGNDEALLDDAVGGLADVVGTVTLEGLLPGDYLIHTFAWVIWDPNNSVWVWLNDEPQPQVIGGPWPGSVQLGVTHATHEIHIDDGRVRINIVAGSWGADWWLNGIQLELLSATGDLNCDGQIDAFDIEPFLVALFDPKGYPGQYPDCDINLADINGDGSIDAFDIEPFIDLLFP